MQLSPKVEKAAQRAMAGGALSKFFSIFMGRCTFFAIIYSIVGIYGWLVLGRDLTSFALFMGASQSLLVLHSWKEDVAEQKAVQQQNTTVVVDANTCPPSSQSS